MVIKPWVARALGNRKTACWALAAGNWDGIHLVGLQELPQPDYSIYLIDFIPGAA